VVFSTTAGKRKCPENNACGALLAPVCGLSFFCLAHWPVAGNIFDVLRTIATEKHPKPVFSSRKHTTQPSYNGSKFNSRLSHWIYDIFLPPQKKYKARARF
jgi:hypothetical protein